MSFWVIVGWVLVYGSTLNFWYALAGAVSGLDRFNKVAGSWIPFIIGFVILSDHHVLPQGEGMKYFVYSIIGTSVLGIVAAIVHHSGLGTPREKPAQITVSFSQTDDVAEEPPIAADIRRNVHLEYRDFDGIESERLVTVMNAYGKPGRRRARKIERFTAYCYLRKAMRTFRMDRVICMADAETGEIIDDPEAWMLQGVRKR